MAGHKRTICRTFFENGDLHSIHRYQDGKPHGAFQAFYYGGQLRQIYYYEHGVPVGDYIRYYQNGGMAQRYSPIAGTKRKKAEYFYPDGKPWGTHEVQDNRFYGPVRIYAADGTLLSALTARENVLYDKDDRRVQGQRRYDYPNGQPFLVETLKDGRLHGMRTLYRKNGTLIWQYYFENGLAEGRAAEYYDDGNLRAYKYYRRHQLLGEKEFDPRGQEIFSARYGNSDLVTEPEPMGLRTRQFSR